jgi:tRNA G18 (ribose-2'-O)-methylase SpoU
MAACREHGLRTLALTPAADAHPLATVIQQAGDAPVALFVGAEGPGLTDPVLAAADHRVTIPMAAGVDSLNVAAAAAVACWILANGG